MIYYSLLILFLFYFIKTAKISDSIKCLQVNQYDDITNGVKVIGDKKKCFNVSSQCCFINITHYYGDHLLKHEYCNYLNVNKTEFEEFLNNMYNDDEMYYANFTANSYETFKRIGRNLDKNTTDIFNCFIGPRSNEEYSTYVINNCKEFKDGVCTGKKNTTQFNEFIENFHKNYSNEYCNKKEDKKKCIRYNGTRSNDKMIKPLLDELADYLQADNDEYKVQYNESNVDIDPDEDDDNGNSSFVEAWKDGNKIILNCTERPIVQVVVECPENYVYQEFINFKLINILFFTFILILF